MKDIKGKEKGEGESSPDLRRFVMAWHKVSDGWKSGRQLSCMRATEFPQIACARDRAFTHPSRELTVFPPKAATIPLIVLLFV